MPRRMTSPGSTGCPAITDTRSTTSSRWSWAARTAWQTLAGTVQLSLRSHPEGSSGGLPARSGLPPWPGAGGRPAGDRGELVCGMGLGRPSDPTGLRLQQRAGQQRGASAGACPAGRRRRLVFRFRDLQLLLRRLRRVRGLEPARPDSDRQRRRVLQELAHGQLRLRRRLPARSERGQSDRRDGRRRLMLDNGKRMTRAAGISEPAPIRRRHRP